MGLLTVCAQHYEGIAWLVGFYVILALLPLWARLAQPSDATARPNMDLLPTRESYTQMAMFVGLVSAMGYTAGTLPCARFFYEGLEGFFGNS
jgi:hypothetical protein